LSEDEHGRFLSGYTANRVFFTYFACPDCATLYCPVYYNERQLGRLYAHQDENMAEAPLEARRRTQEGYARILMPLSRGAGGYLEIGCDIGLFAEACAEKGRFDRFDLYEPNVEVHGELTRRFQGRRHHIRATPFSASDLPEGSVSTAAMIHVLDHLLDPVAALRDIGEVLEPGGVILIVTHDADSLLARVLGRRWPPFTLQHPHLFSPRSMRRVTAAAGLECIKIKKTVNFFPAAYLARAGLSLFGLSPELLPAWTAPLVGVRLGNIAAVARRPE
jgi:SAM-dependent methyltransferase